MISDSYQTISEAAVWLVRSVPQQVIETLIAGITEQEPINRQQILLGISHPVYRETVSEFLKKWSTKAGTLSSQAVAAALVTASQAESFYAQHQRVELAWTGPETGAVSFRRTEQAILEVLHSATEHILLVSFAVYGIPNIKEAIIAAAKRGVRIRIVVETPNRIQGQNEYDCVLALGSEVAAVSTVYYWPQENRETDVKGKRGLLHVKCVVSDSKKLFLSSANLTEYAFSINMELGVLVTGGSMPEQVEKQFDKLVEQAALLSV